MKTILSLLNGAFVITEQAGVFTISINESLVVGGGPAKGVISLAGTGSVVVSGKQAFDLGMALLEAHSPSALVPIEEAAQAMADAAITSA